MMKFFKINNNCLILLGLLVCSCSTVETATSSKGKPMYLPDSFTSENIMSTHMGMTSDEVLKLYGNPKSISQAVCGGPKVGGAWNCTTWEYGKSPYDNANFVFSDKKGSLVVNSFDIKRSESELPKSFTAENILKIRQGISHRVIFELFGPPRNISQSMCGGATKNPWICTTWEYGNAPYANARLTFSTGKDSLVLNDFKVELE